MLIGVPKEIGDHEFRVALTPGGARELVRHGHTVIVEAGAGIESNIGDDAFKGAGAEIVARAEEVYERAHLLLKVKEPQPSECEFLQEGQALFAYLHLAASRELTDCLLSRKVTALAYETVQEADGRLPLLAPMSEVAGRMAPQIGAHFLEKIGGGRGVLLGAVSGVAPARVVVLGAGMVGTNAARMAAGFEAHVTVLDTSLDRLRMLDDLLFGRVTTLASQSLSVEEEVAMADLLIGAVLVAGARAPVLVPESVVRDMKPGAVIVDISIDQGGCVETSRPTTHSHPVFEKHGVLHYGVSNIPGAVPRTSTFALTNASLPYVLRVADQGLWQALKSEPALAAGANMVDGRLTSKPVSEALGLDYYPLSSLIPFDLF